jgi:hypothetical protein
MPPGAGERETINRMLPEQVANFSAAPRRAREFSCQALAISGIGP